MGSFSNAALALGPASYFRLDDLGTALADATGTLADGTYTGSPTQGEPPAVDDGTSVTFSGSGQYANSPSGSALNNKTAYTVCCFFKFTTFQTGTLYSFGPDGANIVQLQTNFGDQLVFQHNNADVTERIRTNQVVNTGAWIMAACRFDAGVQSIFLDGLPVATTPETSEGSTSTAALDGEHWIGARVGVIAPFAGSLDEIIVYDYALTDQQILDLFNSKDVAPNPPLPVTLYGQVQAAASSLPTRLQGLSSIPASNLQVLLEAPDPAHYTAAAARWSASVLLNGLDKTPELTADVTIEHTETSSGVANFQIIPPTGVIDLSDYERKPVEIDFIGQDVDGAILYTVRRFTGITTTAVYNPDTGVIAIDCTTDLQGQLEQLPREVIDKIIGGLWSEHVFDTEVDGWQYALDRLSTTASEIHVNNYGQLVVVPWAAGTPAREFSDASRFSQALDLDRVTRRELISRTRVNMEFRYQRLRHREINVQLVNSIGICGWLNGEGRLPTKGVVTQGATQGQWTRVSDILFTDLPTTPQPGICGGTNFVPSDASRELCLGASWKAARRWAQSVTEQYALDVIAPDLEEAIGQQQDTLDFGVAAAYDATDFEQIREYTGPPTGSDLKPESGDWQLDATEAERTGRAAMEAAQECALALARNRILERARKNYVTFDCVYDPSITIAKTVRLNTPHLKATGKIYRLTESLDTFNGNVELTLRLAISRHGGSGLAVDDPLIPEPQPPQPQEPVTSRQYNMQYRIGGTLFSAPESEDWDGWITNAFGEARTDPDNLYRERFVVIMPEIEEAARDSTDIQAPQSYEVAVPQDELTLSN